MALKRIRSHGERTGVERTDVTIRRHSFTLDEPVAAGGTDTAPTPLEYVVGALNGCVTVLVDLVAADLGITVEHVVSKAVAEQDRDGIAGVPGVRTHFSSVRLDVQVTSSAEAGALEELAAEVERRCPMVNLLRDAQVEVDVLWSAA
ncbi:OsmC family protein [Brachybacterium vulturis]|uniref:OsmC family protein n=1 Tax=Brachybacterium vulturis TaxID=2017484 RepID=UPI0037367DD9